MTASTVSVRPANSQLFITDEDETRGIPPLRRPVTIGRYGAVIATQMSQDGPTEVTIERTTDGSSSPPPSLTLVFSGVIETPSEVVVLEAADRTRYLRVPVGSKKCAIRVAVDDAREPTLVHVTLTSVASH